MKLPNCENAFVDIRKLRDYCLSKTHPVGKNKARVFYSALGLTSDDSEFLRDIIIQKACDDRGLASRVDEYGQRYTLDILIEVKDRSASVRTTWIIKEDEDFPRLTTCHVV